jgi:hypothetical protein
MVQPLRMDLQLLMGRVSLTDLQYLPAH